MEPHLESSMRHHFDLVCNQLNSTQTQLKSAQNQLHETQKQLHETQTELHKTQAQSNETKIQLTLTQMKIMRLEEKVDTNATKKIIWTVNEYSKLLKEAVIKKDFKISSHIFYTERQYGYKLKLTFYAPRGYVAHCKTYLIGLTIMQGEYDPILPWPFTHKVTVTLIDQDEDPRNRKHIVGFFNPGTQAGVCSRPLGKENSERCFSISAKRLEERRFVVDDTLFFQVEFV